jgi:SAM-dependent methyltransferase
VRYGLIPQTLAEGAALALGLVPTPLVDTLVAIWLARSIMVATRLGLFEALADGPLTADALAARCSTDPAATARLVGALVATGYLRQRGARVALSSASRRWLLRDSPSSLYDATLWRFEDWRLTEHFEPFVRSGQPVDFHRTMDAERWELYQRGQRSHAALAAAEVARRTPVPAGARSMLDVGGGHGYFAVALCRRHPGLRATVLDLPEAIAAAAPILARERMGERVVHRPGDARAADLGQRVHDLVLVANLLHHFDQATARDLVGRCAEALRPGGCLVLHELIRPASPAEAGAAGALADLYFAATSRSGTWSFDELAGWLCGAGLRARRPQRLVSVPGLGQVIGVKPVRR